MSALVPEKRASGLKHTSEHLNLLVRNDWIASAWRQQHMHAVEIGGEIHRKRNHRTIQNCARKQVRIQEHQARGVIGAIRIPHRHDTFVSKPVPLGRGCDNIGKLVCAELEIINIEYPFGKPAKKTGYSVSRTLPRGLSSGHPAIERYQ